MKTAVEDLFIKSLPTLDLHGFDRYTARLALEDFINDKYKLKIKKIIVIHGIGSSILKKEVHNTLKKNILSTRKRLFSFMRNKCLRYVQSPLVQGRGLKLEIRFRNVRKRKIFLQILLLIHGGIKNNGVEIFY